MRVARTETKTSLLQSSLAGLVVFAERLNPNPSRTRPLNFPAPMVLSLKAWKSRSLPGLPRTLLLDTMINLQTAASDGGRFLFRWLIFKTRLEQTFSPPSRCAPTRARRCDDGRPSVSRRKGGRQAARLFSNALDVSPRST